MSEREFVENQIRSLEAQQAECRSVHERCEGGLQIMRARLGTLLRAEDEAKVKAEATAAAPAE